jgi:glycosyltransferase involved in cell wall biosynthesis
VQNPEDMATLARMGVPREKLRLLGNGVDLQRFDGAKVDAATRLALREQLGARPDDVVVGAVGRLVLEKGYRELFQAAESVRARLPQALFVVVGPGDPDKGDALPDSDVRRAEAAGVRFLGLRHDVERLYPALDLYVLASHREGFPRSAMEAAASGLPVVATDIRGCRQVVAHGVTGLLVPPRDPEQLAAAIADLVVEPDRRRAMGVAGRQKAVAEFDQQRVIDITLEVYDRLLARRPTGKAA